MKRCAWCGDDPLYVAYHDEEWGVPCRDADRLFELLCLEGAQAGLSWITVLRKREHYRRAFDRFDAARMAQYDDAKVAELLADPGIVRNRAKVAAFIANARAYLAMRERGEDLAALLWSFVGDVPRVNRWGPGETPAQTAESQAMSKALSQRGFKFVGPTICYALMQAAGMVDDHHPECWRHSDRRASPD
ncbi:DNA-3-methyladenine glycosylase [Chitiniphilus shinanonensis]|uniref:DNA-3-methyladenine glycosylase n=1 Tax=Chitiniphilus shinanonensis TaxID=553088 RepID=A0ABQ6BYP9_9NEIS|nr:DNA-3-methyladenine glycosylase I [Chitiniphilus shinanonensis]GLS05013.1 DNA-3-methyladenine glycosylase [Chitiniphilus shinanonensis]